MAPDPPPLRFRPADEEGIPPTERGLYKDANENRALTAGLGGTSIAILTFVLIFLYDRAASGAINEVLFQWTLLNIVVSLFLISLSSVNYWFVMEALRASHPRVTSYLRRADGFFAASLVLLLLEPTLILITVGLYYVGGAALGLWLVGMVVLGLGWRDVR